MRGAITLVALAAIPVAFALGRSSAGDRAAHSSRSAAHPQALLRRVGDRAELAISALPEPPIGEAYEVWLERAGEPPQPTDALFTVTRGGRAAVDIPGSLRGVREVMVTAEPLGGSSAPTSPAILKVTLARHG